MNFKLKAIPFCVLLALAGCNDSDDNKQVEEPCQGTECEAPVNLLPSVNITSPAADTEFTLGGSVVIETNATDSDGEITKVEFYWNDLLIGVSTEAPFSSDEIFVPINAELGSNGFKVIAYDDQGATAEASSTLIVTEALLPPTIKLLLPTVSTALVDGEMLTVQAEATDMDGTITQVEYFLDGTSIGTSSDAANYYEVQSTLSGHGYKKLTLVATDSDGESHVVEHMLAVAPDQLALLFSPDEIYFRHDSSSDQLTVFWNDNSENETGFVVEQLIEGESNWAELTTAGMDETQVTIDSFDRTETGFIRVRAARDTLVSEPSEEIRLVGTSDTLEVAPVVPMISSGQTLTVTKTVKVADGDGFKDVTKDITFPVMQYQTPSDPLQGQATRVSSYFNAVVSTVSGDENLDVPVYETRPQIRNMLAQNDARHTVKPNGNPGHKPYGYAQYGPQEGVAGSSLHNKHWLNIDASEDVVVRVTLSEDKGMVDMDDLVIHPDPLNVERVDDQTFDITLPGATDYARHYRVAVNRDAWSKAAETSYRGEITIESPLFIFVNPMHVAPASAPEGQVKEFDDGALVAFGPGIHLPDANYQFLGEGANETARELYIPGDAYLHYGFLTKNDSYALKIWGRGIYSDEMFALYVHESEEWDDYDWNDSARSQWSHLEAIEGNPWGITQSWNTHVWLQGSYKAEPTIFEGLTNVGARMGVMVKNGSAEVNNHKDVGYGGGTYQSNGAQVAYKGNLLINDDDITYVHEDYTMEHNTSYVMHNGPSFQLGWEATYGGDLNIPTRVSNHTVLSSDRKTEGFWHNHGVFDSRLKTGILQNHSGGVFEDFEFYGKETIIFNLRIWDEDSDAMDTVSTISDKVFKNFNIREASYNKEELFAESVPSMNQQAYIRFIHFDNLVIEGEHIDTLADFDQYFDYNEGLLLHTVTLFSLPEMVAEDDVTNDFDMAPVGQYVAIAASNASYVQSDESLPASMDPLTANAAADAEGFMVVDAGDGYVALRNYDGRYVEADVNRYGYVRVQTEASDEISDSAKFIWVDQGADEFALYSKAMGLYVRLEDTLSDDAPLYAASEMVGTNEVFAWEVHTGDAPVFGVVPVTLVLQAENADLIGDAAGEKSDAVKPTNGPDGSGTAMGWVDAGDWVEFDVNVSDVAYIKVKASTSGFQNRDFDVIADGVVLGQVSTTSSGSWGTYHWSDEVQMQANTGLIEKLRFEAKGGNVNMDAFEVFFVRYNAEEMLIEAASFDAETGGVRGGKHGASSSQDPDNANTSLGYIKPDRSVSYDVMIDGSDVDANLTVKLIGTVKVNSVLTVLADGVEVGSATVPTAGAQELPIPLALAGIGAVDTLAVEFSHPTDSGFLMDMDWLLLQYGTIDPVAAAPVTVEAENKTDSGVGVKDQLPRGGNALGYISSGSWATYEVNLEGVASDMDITFNLVGGSVKQDAVITVLADGVDVGSVTVPTGGQQELTGTFATQGIGDISVITLEFSHPTDTGYIMDVDWFKMEYGVQP